MSAFRAHRGGVDQVGGYNVNAYTMLQWSTKAFDLHERLVNGVWFPVQAGEDPKTVQIGGQVWIRNALPPGDGNPAQYVVKLIRNAYPGVDIGTGIGSIGTFPNTIICSIPSALDIANPGDHYSLWVFVSNGGAIIDGNKAHTWWSASVLG